MREQDWPDGAREAVDAVLDAHFPRIHPGERRYAAEALIAALAPHVTPTGPLRGLADQWSVDVPRLTRLKGHERGLTLSACADELREVLGNG